MSAEQSLPIVLPLVNGKGTKVAKPFYAPGLNNGNHATLPNVQTTYHGNDLDDLFDSKTAARELVNFIVLKYLTTAVSSPFEVSKTLLQVQYMPREDSEVTATAKTKISVNSDDKQKQQQVRNITFVDIWHIFNSCVCLKITVCGKFGGEQRRTSILR